MPTKQGVGCSNHPGRTILFKRLQIPGCKAIPYGTYDVTRDEAVVNVGITHETAEFAVESIRRWWHLLGRKAYPQARRLLICADAGGSNGTRLRAWKVHLQALGRSAGDGADGVPLPTRHEQVEQGRA